MKRQTSAVSPSSSRREAPPEKLHAKTIGCMSGILHFISNSNSRRSRRFLTFGKRQINKNPAPAAAGNSQPENAKAAARNLSSEVPRSPTLPPEIRRSNVKPPPTESRREAPALVVRLMGLEAAPAPPDSVAEKRQKLLGALQRCDEDLKALKKIIEAVRLADPPPQSPAPSPSPSPVVASIGLEDKLRTVSEVKCSVVNGEQQQPSPVSVLDEFTRSPLSPSCPSGRHTFARIQQQKQQVLKKPGEEEISSTYMYERITCESVNKKVNDEEHLVMWSSKAMIKSVDEVCRDVAWGEKRELGRIGLALQDYICKDLIEEIVRELGCFYTLPLEACKRRLCF